MQAQDVYKLAHQAACGPAHAVSDPESARAWLEKKIIDLPRNFPVLNPNRLTPNHLLPVTTSSRHQ